jgi:hypothetical protein
MSRAGNRLDKIIGLIANKPGLRLEEKELLLDEIRKMNNMLCCLPSCEEFCLELVDDEGNIISQNAVSVCTDFELSALGLLNIMLADFEVNTTIEDKLVDLYFTDLTNNNPTHWYWDFGDGNSSTLQNPTHQYADYGLYTVTLIAAKDGAGDIEIKEDYIQITDPNAL